MNRREFIRGTAAASMIGISSKVLWGADAPSNRVRLCFAGVHEKGRGQEPMRWTAKIPGAEIAYVRSRQARAGVGRREGEGARGVRAEDRD